jgi:hypothetical protein
MGRKKGGGGKLNRSEILQTRLNPKLRLGAEIMARIQRRTISSLIEVLVEDAMKQQKVLAYRMLPSLPMIAEFCKKTEDVTLEDAIDYVWSFEEADRFANIAFYLPGLMSPEETRVWQWIFSHPYFWSHFEVRPVTKSGKLLPKKSLVPLDKPEGLLYERLRKQWPLFKSILEGKTDFNTLKDFKAPKEEIITVPYKLPPGVKLVDTRHD